jgi:hypothetical protein
MDKKNEELNKKASPDNPPFVSVGQPVFYSPPPP